MKKHGISREDHKLHEAKKFYSGKWQNTIQRSGKRHQDAKFIKHVLKDTVNSILCVGARHPSEIYDLKYYFEYVIGIDIVTELPGILKMDAHEMSDHIIEGSFDLVYASHCLEHMVDPEKVLRNIRTVSSIGTFITLPMFSETYNSHCSLLDICSFIDKNKEKDFGWIADEVFLNKELMRDFSNLGEYQINSFDIDVEKKEFSMLLTWK